ncbi:hypothetical protein RB195_007463 [Necator americanus]
MYQSRTAQLICVTLQILLLYSYIDHLSTARFFITMALCLYNLFITGMRWSKNIDGRFDFRQMLKEKNTQLKLSYAREVFGPLVIGFLVFLMIRLPGGSGNFIWTLTCCVQIVAALLLLAVEVNETVITRRY